MRLDIDTAGPNRSLAALLAFCGVIWIAGMQAMKSSSHHRETLPGPDSGRIKETFYGTWVDHQFYRENANKFIGGYEVSGTAIEASGQQLPAMPKEAASLSAVVHVGVDARLERSPSGDLFVYRRQRGEADRIDLQLKAMLA